MIRGLQKQTVWLSTPKSRQFEQVCFVLRSERCREAPKDADILREARSILLQAEPQKQGGRKAKQIKPRRLFLMFFGGFLCGIACTLLACALMGAL